MGAVLPSFRADCTGCSRAKKKDTTRTTVFFLPASFMHEFRIIIHAIAYKKIQQTQSLRHCWSQGVESCHALSPFVDRALLDVMDWLLRDLWRSWSLSDGWMCQEGKARLEKIFVAEGRDPLSLDCQPSNRQASCYFCRRRICHPSSNSLEVPRSKVAAPSWVYGGQCEFPKGCDDFDTLR